MNSQQTLSGLRRYLLLLTLLIVLLACSGKLTAVELRFGNSIEYVHPDEVEMVQYCRKAGIGYNLNNQTSNPGGGGIVDTKEGRLIVLYLNTGHALTFEQLKPLIKASQLSNFNCPSWADDEILGFFTHPGRFPKVTGLSIYRSSITDEGLARLKNFPVVASLNLESTTITDKGVLHLSKIPTLSFLRLNATRITDKGVSYLTDLPDLSFLELKTTQITDDGLEHLGRLPKLHTLYLDDTAITGSGMRHLAPLTQLRMLSLNNTPFQDRGLGELVEHPNLAKVEVLYLANTRITDAGCPAFEGLNNLIVLTIAETAVTDKGIRHINNMPRLYNLGLGPKVTAAGRSWLAENARFASSLQLQLRKAARAGQKQKTNEMDLRTFQDSLSGADAFVFQLGRAARDSSVDDASQKLLKMKAEAIKPILDMAEKTVDQTHPLSKAGSFRFHFRNNASAIVRAVCIESMPSLADQFADSQGKRELISHALERGGDEIIPHLEDWFEHKSPLVRLEALQQLARRAKIRNLGPGAASPTTLKHNSLHLSQSGRQRVYRLLTDPTANVQQAACEVALAMADQHAVKAEALVNAALREQHPFTLYRMQEALYFLAEQEPVDGKGLPALINGFVVLLRKTDRKEAQHIAMRQLGRLGGKSQGAMGLLTAFQEGPDEQLAAAAGGALDEIRRCPITQMRLAEVPEDVQNLVFTLTTYDQNAIDQATKELARRGPTMIRPLLTAARGQVDEYFPQRAAAVVAQWNQEDVLPLLRPVFNQTRTSVRLLVIYSISRMKWSELPGVVQESLEGVDAKVRGQMRNSLSTLAENTTGQASQELARLIATELKSPGLDWPLASRLTKSLTSCYPDSSEVPSLLIGILKQDAGHSSCYACSALGEMAQEGLIGTTDNRKKIVQTTLGVLQTTENEYLKTECMGSLARFGAEAQIALPTLRQVQKEGSENLARSATRAIAAIDGRSNRPTKAPRERAAEDPFGGRE